MAQEFSALFPKTPEGMSRFGDSQLTLLEQKITRGERNGDDVTALIEELRKTKSKLNDLGGSSPGVRSQTSALSGTSFSALV